MKAKDWNFEQCICATFGQLVLLLCTWLMKWCAGKYNSQMKVGNLMLSQSVNTPKRASLSKLLNTLTHTHLMYSALQLLMLHFYIMASIHQGKQAAWAVRSGAPSKSTLCIEHPPSLQPHTAERQLHLDLYFYTVTPAVWKAARRCCDIVRCTKDVRTQAII